MFQVLVVAPGYAPTFFNKVDPMKGSLTARLKPIATTNIPPSEMQVTTPIPENRFGGHGWMSQPQRKFTARPGDDLDLGDVEKSAPPKSAW